MFKIDGNTSKMRRGFTFIEMIVVVLLVGILAAVAAPKMFNVAAEARENNAKHHLSIIRNAIDLYRTGHGEYPGQIGGQQQFKIDLSEFIRESFPVCAVGNKNDNVKIYSTGAPLAAGGGQGWAYDNVTGEFIINYGSYSSL